MSRRLSEKRTKAGTKHILIAIDLDDENSWGKPLDAAVELARRYGAQLYALTIIRDFDAMVRTGPVPIGYELMRDEAENRLAGVIRGANACELQLHLIVRHAAIVYAEILRIAKDVSADLIVMGSRRPEMKDFLLGSNASRVVRHAPCSFLVVRDQLSS